MTDTHVAPVAGWYPDPADAGSHRWWSGAGWTAHTRPLVAAPGALVAPLAPVAIPPGATDPPTPAFGSIAWRDQAAVADRPVGADAPVEHSRNPSATAALVGAILIVGALFASVLLGLPIAATRLAGVAIIGLLGLQAIRRSRVTHSGRVRSIVALGIGAILLAPIVIQVLPTLLFFLI